MSEKNDRGCKSETEYRLGPTEKLWDQPLKCHLINTWNKSYSYIKTLKKPQVRKLHSEIKTTIKFPQLCVFNSKLSVIDAFSLFADLLLIDLPYPLNNVLASLKSVWFWTNKHTNSTQCQKLCVDVQSYGCYLNF